jgi:hypothetical protein
MFFKKCLCDVYGCKVVKGCPLKGAVGLALTSTKNGNNSIIFAMLITAMTTDSSSHRCIVSTYYYYVLEPWHCTLEVSGMLNAKVTHIAATISFSQARQSILQAKRLYLRAIMRQFLALLFSIALFAAGCNGFVSHAFLTPPRESCALHMTLLTYGSKQKDFPPGSKLSAACSSLGVKPRYSCKK